MIITGHDNGIEMKLKNVIKKVNKTMFPETWCLAVRFNADDSTNLLNDTDTPFTVIPNTKEYWCADPFLFEKDGTLYAFFEVLDYSKRKGLLGYRTVSENGFGNINIIYEDECHLSFPFIYEENGEIYMVPESSKSNTLFRLKCKRFPDVWEKEKVLLEDEVVDTVIFDKDNVRYYVSQRVDSEKLYNRLDVFYDDNGELKEIEGNPQKLDSCTARGAGKVFSFDGGLIRPSQDCGTSYGEKLNFNKIIRLDKSCYKEKLIKTVNCSDIKLDADNNFDGIHTYNKLGNVEIIDLRIPSSFSIRNTIGAVNKILK